MSQRPRRNIRRINYARLNSGLDDVLASSESEAEASEEDEDLAVVNSFRLLDEKQEDSVEDDYREEDRLADSEDENDDVQDALPDLAENIAIEFDMNDEDLEDTASEDDNDDSQDALPDLADNVAIEFDVNDEDLEDTASEEDNDDARDTLPDVADNIDIEFDINNEDVEEMVMDDDALSLDLELPAPMEDEAREIEENVDEISNFGPQHIVTAPDGTEWTYLEPPTSRRRAHNMLPVGIIPGPGPAARGDISMLGLFNLFFSERIQDCIVQFTNQYALIIYGVHREVFNDERQWLMLDRLELQGFVGLLLRAGISRNYDQRVSKLWSRNPQKRQVAFAATMSRTRFQLLVSLLRFDDVEQRRPGLRDWIRRKFVARRDGRASPIPALPQVRQSNLDAISNVFNPFVWNLQSHFEPGTNIKIDEMLVRFRGNCPFRVYMPKKPGRYGMKIWTAVDSETGYILDMQIYEGKIGPEPERELGKRIVQDLTELYQFTNRGITADNFFTSKVLTDQLLEHGLTYVGTIRKSRREIPRSFSTPKHKVLQSSHFLYSGDTTIVNYVSKKSKGVLLLSTQHHDEDIPVDNNPKRKPEIILHYNSTKGGVDTVDQMVQRYACQRQTRQWPMKIFFLMLDVAALNAYRLWIANNAEWERRNRSKRREFLFQLSLAMILPCAQRRSETVDLHSHIKEAMRTIGVVMAEPAAVGPGYVQGQRRWRVPRRCVVCRKNTRTGCSNCGNPICANHQDKRIFCATCSPQDIEVNVN